MERMKAIIEAILFAAGRQVTVKELVLVLEISKEDLENIIENMKQEYKNDSRGIEIIKIEDSYQLCTKKDLYEYIYPILDKRTKPNLSIESIRGVSADACIYKLLEYGLIEEAGKSDLPGKPMTYQTTNQFLKMFGYSSLEDLPQLPRYKLDENKQIVIEEIMEDKEDNEKKIEEKYENNES